MILLFLLIMLLNLFFLILESVTKQTHILTEIVLVSSCSTDDTLKITTEFADYTM
jgi:hypothetical protein